VGRISIEAAVTYFMVLYRYRHETIKEAMINSQVSQLPSRT